MTKLFFLQTTVTCLSLLPVSIGYAAENVQYAPSLNPPRVERKESLQSLKQTLPKRGATTEWIFHKSLDGSHPDGNEQQIMWLMNRARTNPTLEGQWLATETDPDVAGGRDYFHVDLTILQNEFAALEQKPPAAFDIRLYNAALAHSLDLISRDAQDHEHQFDRVDDARFYYTQGRGNVFSYANSGLNAHAAFNIDWGGDDGTGMQTDRGHRMAIMSADGDYTNVGIAAVAEADPTTNVGPLVITGNYCKANTDYADHYNLFIVGTVWRDSNSNNIYDPGEGLGGIKVIPDSGNHYAVTGNSGGYAIPVSAGSYTVTFQGSALPDDEVKSITVDQESVLLDLILQDTPLNTFPWPLFLPAILGHIHVPNTGLPNTGSDQANLAIFKQKDS